MAAVAATIGAYRAGLAVAPAPRGGKPEKVKDADAIPPHSAARIPKRLLLSIQMSAITLYSLRLSLPWRKTSPTKNMSEQTETLLAGIPDVYAKNNHSRKLQSEIAVKLCLAYRAGI